ncbi:sodium:solute symporter family transporter [Treponema pedis]|uniref:MscS family small conductance mechanosenstiveion channel n=1 Tax=Treponema pedis str. T A4 TaxID=1291379 RepID=S6A8Q5_9SPIR|nr:mechanosensitive ion channel protein MscS [Treponema pedis]AGT44239.1 MscS family small conductance mechanosenstiveion channel [Treponema pedis str. T A4]
MFNAGLLFWGFLIVYGLVMTVFSPKAVSLGGFFRGEDKKGRESSPFMLTASIFISWIFAKSVTNAANLGAAYGIVGGIAYAIYWLCIPLAGFAIYRLRKKYAASGLVSFLTDNYGKGAAIAFSAAILIRLFNEVWSNTSVVGGYYGKTGSGEFIIAASLFTLITLVYSMRGGLRSSIVTDAIQAVIFVFFVAWIIAIILPNHSIGTFISSGNWKLDAGVDMLLVSVLQIFSYPFHDPVLTDRGFISNEKDMLKSFIIAGALGFIAILVFSFIGIHSSLNGLPLSGNVPADLGKSLGITAYFVMIAVMISAAGSTLDSTFSSLAKLTAYDFPRMNGKDLGANARKIGMAVMVIIAVLGNLPMIMGTDILKATTISGTMIMGLAPVFLLHGIVKPTKLGFHLSFWSGIILGFAFTFNMLPEFLAMGTGKYALLLGANFYGLILCTAGYILPGIFCKNTVN